MFSLAFCHFSWLVHKLEGLALYCILREVEDARLDDGLIFGASLEIRRDLLDTVCIAMVYSTCTVRVRLRPGVSKSGC